MMLFLYEAVNFISFKKTFNIEYKFEMITLNIVFFIVTLMIVDVFRN